MCDIGYKTGVHIPLTSFSGEVLIQSGCAVFTAIVLLTIIPLLRFWLVYNRDRQHVSVKQSLHYIIHTHTHLELVGSV